MARTVRDANLETRAARMRLGTRPEPYWRAIDRGAHLGYYKGTQGGSWVARLYLGGRYYKTALGKADDVSDADGIAILSYRQAQDKAREWFSLQARRAAGIEPMPSGPYTVRDAITDYLTWFEENRKAAAATKAAANAQILPTLGIIELAKLTPAAITKWVTGLIKAPARLRSPKGKPVRHATR